MEKSKYPQHKIINVSCAVIVSQTDQVLVTQRSGKMSLPHKWEFPGGKIEQGETPEQTIVREIQEELQLTICITDQLPTVNHHYQSFSITLVPFICRIDQGEIKLTEHQAFRWLNPDKLLDLDWAEADIPVAQYYLRTLKK